MGAGGAVAALAAADLVEFLHGLSRGRQEVVLDDLGKHGKDVGVWLRRLPAQQLVEHENATVGGFGKAVGAMQRHHPVAVQRSNGR